MKGSILVFAYSLDVRSQAYAVDRNLEQTVAADKFSIWSSMARNMYARIQVPQVHG